MEDASWTLPQEWDKHFSLLIFFSGTSKFLHTLCGSFSTFYEELGSVWICSVKNEYSLGFPGLNDLLANCLRWWDLGEFLPGPLQPYFAKQGQKEFDVKEVTNHCLQLWSLPCHRTRKSHRHEAVGKTKEAGEQQTYISRQLVRIGKGAIKSLYLSQ